jgi:hypothetical protein
MFALRVLMVPKSSSELVLEVIGRYKDIVVPDGIMTWLIRLR